MDLDETRGTWGTTTNSRQEQTILTLKKMEDRRSSLDRPRDWSHRASRFQPRHRRTSSEDEFHRTRQSLDNRDRGGAKLVATWVLALLIASICGVGMITTKSYEYFTMWSLTIQLKAAFVLMVALLFPKNAWIASLEALGTPTAFVIAVSVFVSTIVMATDHTSQSWFFSGSSIGDAYAQYILAHVVTPILFAFALWTSYECTHKDTRSTLKVDNVIIIMASATISLEFWATFFNPELVYHTNIDPGYLILAYFGTTAIASILAVLTLGARPLS